MTKEFFTCAKCGEVFEKIRPDAEAFKESRFLWGDTGDSEYIVVCDDCFGKFTVAELKQITGLDVKVN